MFDTHCHLDDSAYDKDLENLLEISKENGVNRFIIPGANPNDLEKAQKLAHCFEEVYFAVGVHPYHLEDYQEEHLRHYIEDKKCIAVGECGLDYYRLPKGEEQEVKRQQKEVFEAQIQLAKEFDKPLILHVREASYDTFQILKEHGIENLRGVLHCFNADSILLELSSSFYYGIGGVLTFKNAKRLVEILPKIPKERLLLETDAPYLTPEPHRGKRNSPEYIPIIAEKMGELLGLQTQEIEAITNENANRLFWKNRIA